MHEKFFTNNIISFTNKLKPVLSQYKASLTDSVNIYNQSTISFRDFLSLKIYSLYIKYSFDYKCTPLKQLKNSFIGHFLVRGNLTLPKILLGPRFNKSLGSCEGNKVAGFVVFSQ